MHLSPQIEMPCPRALFRVPAGRWTGCRIQHSQLTEGNRDDAVGNCVQESWRHPGSGLDRKYLHFWPNQTSSNRPGRARWSSRWRHSAQGSYSRRNCVLPGWAESIRGDRSRGRRHEQWSRSSLQLQPVRLLPFAAGFRRNQPREKSPWFQSLNGRLLVTSMLARS